MIKLEKIALIQQLLPYPLAIYQEKSCIFQKDINSSNYIASLNNYLWPIAEEQKITITYFNKLVLATTKFKAEKKYFMIVVLFEEHTVSLWNDDQWDSFSEIISTVTLLLKKKRHLPIKRNQAIKKLFLKENNESTLLLNNPHDFIDNYHLEKIFLNELKVGNFLSVQKILKNLISINNTQLSDDGLRDKKYRLVSLITLLTRSSIESGCPTALSYRLSDQLIQQLDQIDNQKDLEGFLPHLVNEFFLLMKNYTFRYSSFYVNKAIEYIYQNLYKKVYIADISNSIGITETYLSHLFKKETGLSIKQFTNKMKVKEAKYLLNSSELTLRDISERLHFSNQSYFCKIFKQETGYTPKDFRILF